MAWMGIVVAILFSIVGLVCLLLVVLGLPGTWILLALALAIELLDARYLAPGADITFGWWVLGTGVVLAGVGEVLEATAGAAGVRRGGGTRRGMVGAVIGGMLGALFFTPTLPIPFLGTLVGALVGTFVGALVAEATSKEAKRLYDNTRAAFSATLGRLVGTMGKTLVASVVWVMLVVAAFMK